MISGAKVKLHLKSVTKSTTTDPAAIGMRVSGGDGLLLYDKDKEYDPFFLELQRCGGG